MTTCSLSRGGQEQNTTEADLQPVCNSSKKACEGSEGLPKWLIPSDRRGWRKIVQNFTPAWVRSSRPKNNYMRIRRLTWKQVRSHNGHRNRCCFAAHALRSVPGSPWLTENSQHRFLRHEYRHLLHNIYHIFAEIHPVPSNMDADATSSGAVALSRHDANGIRYHCKHVCCNLRASMGRFSTLRSLEHVVAGRSHQCCLLSLVAISNVCALSPFCLDS